MAKKKTPTKKRFTENQWKAIFKEFNDNGRSHGLPAVRVDSFVIASWNLRQFGTIQGKRELERRRDIEAFRFIASIISHFDLVAIQEVKDDLASLRELIQLLPDYDVVVSDMTGNTERVDAARAAAQSVLSSSSLTPRSAWIADIGLALLAVQRDERAEAEELYSALEPVRASFPAEGHICISMDRLLGLLSHTLGNYDKVTEHFEDALVFCRRAG